MGGGVARCVLGASGSHPVGATRNGFLFRQIPVLGMYECRLTIRSIKRSVDIVSIRTYDVLTLIWSTI